MSSPVNISIIVARARNGVIGKDGQLPWTLRDDLAFFKQVTSGKPVIMGRKTWESLPKRPLPGRENIVLSRDWTYGAEGARVYSSLGPALNVARSMAIRAGENEVFIIGGAELYRTGIAVADRLYITNVEVEIDGDATFPDFSLEDWRKVSETAYAADARNTYAFTICRYDCRHGITE